MLKNLITKEQVLTQSGTIATAVADDIVLGSKVRFSYDTEKGITLDFNDKHLRMSQDATHHFCRQIHMPIEQVRTVPANLMVPVLNYYNDRMSEKKVRVLNDNDNALALAFSPRDQYTSVPRIIDIAEDIIGVTNIEGYHNPFLRWDNSCINIVLTRTFQPLQNDLLNVGIRIEHSLDEYISTRARAYTFRQFCSNGAVTMDNLGTWNKRKKSDSLRTWLGQAIEEANKAFELEESRLRKLTEIRTNNNTAKILDSILVNGGVSKKIRNEIKNAAIDTPTESLYDVYNLLTRTATYSELLRENPSALMLVENVAGELSFHSQLCPVCQHVVHE